MNTITSLYIPHIEKQYNAEYIADIFSKNDLAQVSRIFIEPYKSTMKNRLNYNRAYIQIDYWHETEAAYSFIRRLHSPCSEARLVHSDENWWLVDINKYPTKFTSNNRVLTIFLNQNVAEENDDYFSTVAVGNVEDDNAVEEFITIDAEKTKLLRDIVAKFKENQERELMKQEEDDTADYEAYNREVEWVRNPMNLEIICELWN